MEHLFIHCTFTTSLWSYLDERDDLSQFLTLQSLINYLINLKTNTKTRAMWSNIIAVTLWNI